jgi:hypothetical protein
MAGGAVHGFAAHLSLEIERQGLQQAAGKIRSRSSGENVKYFALLILAASLASSAQEYTRGIGVYPGDPREYAGPSLAPDAHAYRNLALHRPAYQSSAYDYNLTATSRRQRCRSGLLPPQATPAS